MSVTNDATVNTVTDNGPGGPRGPRGAEQAMTAQGLVKFQLHGPQGELNGALLDDGTIIRLPPPAVRRLAAELTPGATIYVEGDDFPAPLGRVVGARSIGPGATQLTRVAAPPPPGPGRYPPPGVLTWGRRRDPLPRRHLPPLSNGACRCSGKLAV